MPQHLEPYYNNHLGSIASMLQNMGVIEQGKRGDMVMCRGLWFRV